MSDSVLSLQVQRVTFSNRFVWMILERGAEDEAVEIAASLWTYDKPSEAYEAGATVLQKSERCNPQRT
ncbi:hypothetical protein [Variovorax sp. AFSI2.2]|uniref:hypothetical protein n=1 Tax=Variovorax sp. AFSI2.2 TaxID=3384160 RepID=UPI003EC1093E